MDNLEQFIRDNREEFDTAVPSLKVWAELDKKLPQTATQISVHKVQPLAQASVAKVFSIRKFLSMAAAVTLLIGFGIGIGFTLAPQGKEAVALSDISPEYAEVEQYYAQQVNTNLAVLASFDATTPAIKADLAEIDAWMEDLQKELSIVPDSKKEAVINDIIDLYKTKVAILDKLLESIQSSNQKNSIQNETVDI
ncbi:MAG: hypothetical protein AAGJ18_09070 [Bacteroidota bacterium]